MPGTTIKVTPPATGKPQALTLRGYEAEIIDQATSYLAEGRDVLIEAHTGAGKTLMARVIVRELIRLYPGTIVAAPMGHIEAGFVADGVLAINWPEGSSRSPVKIPAKSFRMAKVYRSSTGCVVSHLSSARPFGTLTCTHATLCRVASDPDSIPADLSGRLLVIDEAHHVGADGLGRFVDLWVTRGGRLLYLSATPYRGDGRPVVRPGMAVIRRGLDQAMDEGYAPRRLIHAIEPIGHAGEKMSASEFVGSTVTRDPVTLGEIADRMVARWESDGRPKTIVRVPPTSGGTAALMAVLLGRFRKVGARCLDATGKSEADQERVLEALAGERGRSKSASAINVVIGSQRVVEGMDWPHASTVYAYGIPSSMTLAVQLHGRTTRRKPGSYPLPDREVSRSVYFVRTAGGETIDHLSAEQAKHALLVCAFLVDHEMGSRWIATRAVRDAVGDQGVELPTVDAETRATVQAVISASVESNPDATIGQGVEQATKRLPGLDQGDVVAVAVEMMATGDDAAVERLRRSVAAAVTEFRAGPEIAVEIREVLAKVVGDLRDERIKAMRSVGAMSGLAVALTGRGMGDWARRVVNLPFPTDDAIRAAARDWKERTGRRPTKDSGFCPALGRHWCSIYAATRHRISFGELIGMKMSRHTKTPPMKEILRCAAKFKAENGRLPGWNDRFTLAIDDLTWGSLDRRLNCTHHRTLRGLFINSGERVKPTHLITDDEVVESAMSYFAETGLWPGKSDKTRSDIAPGLDIQWGSLNHFRAQSGLTSIAVLLADRGLKPRHYNAGARSRATHLSHG